MAIVFANFGSISANDKVLNDNNRINRTQSDILGHKYAISKFGVDIKSKNCKRYLFSYNDIEEYERMK